LKEMLIVGRGGQGVVLASQLLADTFARAGYWVQSFPEFKAERRGAPISAFFRWDERAPIHRRYKLRDCDVLVTVSASPPTPQALDRVRPGGLVVLNRESRYPYSGPYEVARVPASLIALGKGILSSEGRPMGNTAVLGACVRLLLPDGLEYLEQAISARMGVLAAPNIAAARDGHRRCTRQRALAGDTPAEHAPAPPGRHDGVLFPISYTDSLFNHTGSWSEERPVLHDACNACALCALFCPEGAITRHDGVMTFDEAYCKGCGICEVVCPVKDAIEMAEVRA
jgi:pyruvate ferredoxin oxidoreductase gamma subunit